MRNPITRRNRRNKAIELTLFYLVNMPDGIKVSELQQMVENATKFRCSSNTLGQFMSPYVMNGTIEKTLTSEGHSFWKLTPLYIPSKETD